MDYRGTSEKGEVGSYRPWNKLSPSFAENEEFPFITIPVERDITTIVGANESGKSHLLNAIAKVIRGSGTDPQDEFKRTDLCHYASVRTKNAEAWPNIGLEFTMENKAERQQLNGLVGASVAVSDEPVRFALLLAPDRNQQGNARISVETSGSGASHSTTPFFF
jgi:ABC-type phosphate/phosphonate transport system ATPase subunit